MSGMHEGGMTWLDGAVPKKPKKKKHRNEKRHRMDPESMWRWTMGVVAAAIAVLLLVGCSDTEVERPTGVEIAARTVTETPSRPVRTGLPEPTPPEEPADPFEGRTITYEEAESVFQSGEYRLAADMFERYSERVPANAWGPYMLGISAWRDLDHQRAEAALRRTIELDPDHSKGLLNLARVLLEQGKGPEALDFANRVVELDPELGEGWRVLGNVHAELQLSGAAAEAYLKAIALDPADAWTMNNLGLLRIREGRYGDAIPPLARATELRPDMPRFQNNLGVALERTGHMAQAVDAYGAALVEDAEYERARVSLDRVTELLPLSRMEPIDLGMMARTFADDVERRRGTAFAEGPGNLVPIGDSSAVDTTDITEPVVTIETIWEPRTSSVETGDDTGSGTAPDPPVPTGDTTGDGSDVEGVDTGR